MSSDIPTGLTFVNPDEITDTYRVCLWGPSGVGKSVAAASAPGPILVVSADRPTAYKFSRQHYPDTQILETRWTGVNTLNEAYRHLADAANDIKTVVLDPVSNIIDHIRDEAPQTPDGPDHQWVNKKFMGFIKELRRFDINVVLVAYEKLNDGKGGDGKLYPAVGGASLINKVLGEMDIVAHIERHTTDDTGEVKYVGQLQPRGNLVCKESVSAGALGERRIADLSRWFEVASEALAPTPADDVPFATQAELDAAAAADEKKPAKKPAAKAKAGSAQ